MRTSSTWRVALALLLVLPLAGACKKKGPKPGEAGAGAGLGEEGLGASGSSLERQKRGLPPEEDGILKDVHFAYDSYDLDGAARDALTQPRLAAPEQPRQDRARGALRQPGHHRVQPGARGQAVEGREGLPGGTGHPRRARLDHQLRQGVASLPRGERHLLGAQPAGPLGDPRPVSARPTRAAALALAALAGCATRAELVQQDHQLQIGRASWRERARVRA